MTSVEPQESPSAGLKTFSNGVDIFDTYKSARSEDRDSDEESFHLPILDSDEDNKDVVQNGETEEDILNRFDTGTPELDPKCEDSILNDKDEQTENVLNCDDESAEKGTDAEKPEETEKKSNESLEKEKEDILDQTDKNVDLLENLKNDDKLEKEKNGDPKENEKNDDPMENEDRADPIEKENKDVEKENNDDSVEEEKGDGPEEREKNEDVPVETEKDKRKSVEEQKEQEIGNNVTDDSSQPPESLVNNLDENVEKTCDHGKVDEPNKTVCGDENDDEFIENEDNCESVTVKEEVETEDCMEVDDINENKENCESITVKEEEIIVPKTEDSMEVNDDIGEEVSELGTSDQDKIKTEEEPQIEETANTLTESSPADSELNESCDKADEKLGKECETGDEENKIDTNKKESCGEEMELDQTITEEDKNTNINTTEPEADKTIVAEQVAGDKIVSEKNGKEITPQEAKNDSLECDDLLNISVIRDVDEDNAAAIAEHSNDINSSEKSDNDDQDEDKGDNEVDDSEMDQDDNMNSSDKDENMEFDDESSSNFCDQETTTNDESTMDARINKDFDNDSNSASNKDSEETTALETTVPEPQKKTSPEIEPEKEKNEVKDKQDELSDSASQNKRPLSEIEEDSAPKKMRLSDKFAAADLVKPLNSFREFMQSRKMKGKLTRSDLEQFVLQKVCEVIMHKHEIGDLHQTLKRQEQTIENLRKDVQQLSKQTRDLDIVNKKLMNELKLQNGNKKPLVPLKITRSVGLQVKLNIGNEVAVRRKSQIGTQNNVPSQRTPVQNTPAQRNRSFTPTNNTVVRQIASPRKTPQPQQQQSQQQQQQQQQQQPVQTPKTPILSQALQQTRQASPATPVAKRTPPVKKQQPEAAKPNTGVIDLTDEDDKAAKSQTTNNYTKVVTKTIPLTIQKGITLTQSKQGGKNQTKTIPVRSQVRPVAKQDTPARAITSLPQGVRMTPSQMKNSIAIPTSVMTSNSGTTAQVMYVVQPSNVVTSSANGNPKTLLLNFQPNNGVLSSTLNGSTVSVISKPGNSVLKPILPRKHPAPLPLPPPIASNLNLKPLLPKPVLSIRKTDTGIILQWRMPYNLDLYEGIASYQLFAYQETSSPPSTDMWRKVGDVKALALPMACTLTQFVDKNKYYFAVRSVDVHKRLGAFSDPEEISL